MVTHDLLKEFNNYLLKISEESYRLLLNDFENIFTAIDEQIGDPMETDDEDNIQELAELLVNLQEGKESDEHGINVLESDDEDEEEIESENEEGRMFLDDDSITTVAEPHFYRALDQEMEMMDGSEIEHEAQGEANKEQEKKKKPHRLVKLKMELEAHLKEPPVLGFNNGRNNNAGGPSLIFMRYQEVGKTKLREVEMTAKGQVPEECKRILGYDANALYLYAISQDMPTGPTTQDAGPKPILNLRTREEWRTNVTSELYCMKQFSEDNDMMKQPRHSLIGSMYGEKILLATPLLKWYLEHGFEVTQVYQVVEFTPEPCFSSFGVAVSNAHRAGDVDPSKAIIADTMKLVGNSSYGKTITNQLKHREVRFSDDTEASGYHFANWIPLTRKHTKFSQRKSASI
ncbi:hypothetical protein QZH41_012528 [Actinostola sp. cb2023]|nr:hypothetical protein QZH41_012528 [Actinostola sp. cb2023]